MSARYGIYMGTSAWYALSAIGHQQFGSQIFNDPSLATVKQPLMGSYKGNYYAGTIWMAVGAYLHYIWATEPSQNVHARRLTAVFTSLWAGLAFFYRLQGPPGVWPMVSVTSGLEALCCAFA